MTSSTYDQANADPATDAIDLSAARRLARGAAQQAWLTQLTTATGLRVADHLPRRWSAATYDRMTAFLTKLWAAGYDLAHRPGPRGGRGTWQLCGYRPGQATHRRIITALGYNIANSSDRRWQPSRLLAMLAAEDSETLRTATYVLELARWAAWRGLPVDTSAPHALARVVDACRAPAAASSAGESRGVLLAKLLNGSRAGGASFALDQAALIADALTVPPPRSSEF